MSNVTYLPAVSEENKANMAQQCLIDAVSNFVNLTNQKPELVHVRQMADLAVILVDAVRHSQTQQKLYEMLIEKGRG